MCDLNPMASPASAGTIFKIRQNVVYLYTISLILKGPDRIVPRFCAEWQLTSCLSSHLDPIGDRNDV